MKVSSAFAVLAFFPALPGAEACNLLPLLPSDDPRFAIYGKTNLPLSIDADPFAGRDQKRALSQTFAPSLWHPTMKMQEYERRALEFAADGADKRAITSSAIGSDGRVTKIKFHLTTGELLVVDGSGKIAAFVRLPVGERPLGHHQWSYELANALIGTVAHSDVDGTKKTYARLTAGEPLSISGFRSFVSLRPHFEKHVLRLKPNESLEQAYTRFRTDSRGELMKDEFHPQRAAFFEAWSKIRGDIKAELQLIEKSAAAYEEAGRKFARSTASQILTYTRLQPDPGRPGQTDPLAIRFDPISRELAVIDRRTGILVTYYRVEGDLRLPNLQLTGRGLAPAATAFEYFLALATAP